MSDAGMTIFGTPPYPAVARDGEADPGIFRARKGE